MRAMIREGTNRLWRRRVRGLRMRRSLVVGDTNRRRREGEWDYPVEDLEREGDRVYLVDLGRGDDWEGKGGDVYLGS